MLMGRQIFDSRGSSADDECGKRKRITSHQAGCVATSHASCASRVSCVFKFSFLFRLILRTISFSRAFRLRNSGLRVKGASGSD